MVVACLLAPSAGRVLAHELVEVDAAIGEVIEVRRDLLEEDDVCALGCPHAESHIVH